MSNTFELSRDKVKLNERISAIAAGVSIFCCLVVLGLSAWIWSVKQARGYLNRISFRLLLWSLAFEIIYDINYIAVVVGGIKETIDPRGCVAGIYFMMATMGIVNYLCTFIAVNLAITIVFGLNPILLRLERWYVGISLFIGLFVPLVPAILGHFGTDPLFHVCWIQADTDKARIRNFVLDLYVWQLLSCLIASVAVIATLITLFRQGRATSRALFGGSEGIHLDLSDSSGICEGADKDPPRRGVVFRMIQRRRNSLKNQRVYGHLEDKFIRIALRISTYPIALIIVNGIISIADLYISAVGGVHNKTVYGLYVLYYFLYGGRGIVFVLLALVVDPCLQRGLRAAWTATNPRRSTAHAERLRYLNDLKNAQGQSHPGDGPEFRSTFGNAFGPKKDASSSTMRPHRQSGSGIAPDEMGHSKERSGQTATTDGWEAEEVAEGRGGEPGEMDMMQALFALSGPADNDTFAHEWRSSEGADTILSLDDRARVPAGHSRRRSLLERIMRRSSSGQSHASQPPDLEVGIPEYELAQFSTTFAGVPAGAIPEGLEDHAHDVVDPHALDEAKAMRQLEHAVRSSPTRSGSSTPPAGPLDRLASIDKLTRRATRLPGGARTPGSGRASVSASGSRPNSGTVTPVGSVRGSRDLQAGRNELSPKSEASRDGREARGLSGTSTYEHDRSPQPSVRSFSQFARRLSLTPSAADLSGHGQGQTAASRISQSSQGPANTNTQSVHSQVHNYAQSLSPTQSRNYSNYGYMRNSLRSGRRQSADSGIQPSFSSIAGAATLEERAQRRERALELAERLYDEIEAQL